MEQQETKGRGRLFQKLLALLLSIVCFISCTIDTMALTMNGSASSGGSGSSASSGTGSYGLPSFVNDEYINAPAYRFTVVDSLGVDIEGIPSIDVYKKAYSKYAGTNYKKFENKYPKTILKTLYKANNELKTIATSERCIIDSDYGLELPKDTTKMLAWGKSDFNIEILLEDIFGVDEEDGGIATLKKNEWSILVEPIYPVTLEGENHSLTVTEIAFYGAKEFGANTIPPSSGDPNSWAWISNYTNKLYPNALKLNTDDLTMLAPAELTFRASFATIIEEGYGAAVIAGEADQGAPPNIIRWTYSQVGAIGFNIYVQVENADKLQIPVWTELSGQDDLVWYDAVKTSETRDGHTYNWYIPVSFADHNDELGLYNTHFYASNAYDMDKDAGTFTPVSEKPVLVAYRAHQKGTGYTNFDVYLKINNVNTVTQWTGATDQLSDSVKLYSNENEVVAGKYVLDGEEYNYKISNIPLTYTIEGIPLPYWEQSFTTVVRMRNDYGASLELISYDFSKNVKGVAEATTDGKGFYVYADSLYATSFVFKIGTSLSYPGEEGMYVVNGKNYNYRAFVPYEDCTAWLTGDGRYDTFTIEMHAGNDYTFTINADKTTTPVNSVHNPYTISDEEYDSVVLFADKFQFTPPYYTITYSSTGGVTVPNTHYKTKYIDTTLSSKVPQRAGYIFAGWDPFFDEPLGGGLFGPGWKYDHNSNVTLYAQWVPAEDFSLAGTGRATIKVGDVFDPMMYLDAFSFPEARGVVATTVTYNGVPRDEENKATTAGTGYTVVYKIAFDNDTFGEYRLIVTVLDAGDVVEGPKGFIRFISNKFLDTLNVNSKWRFGSLKALLERTLAILKPTDEDAVQVWHFSPSDVQDVKDWVKEGKEAGKSREEQNAEFGDQFNKCKTK